ncbi:uncharacterized protein DFL_000416 [Arthrobotrys flagrans]|nr:hypothetical protein DFL_000416 [Arthrobotrys flagrans]
MAAEARYNIEVLNRKLRDPSISAARRSEAREQISDFEKRLAVLKISMALNAHRRKEALEEYQRSTHQYDQDQLIFNEAVGGTNKYTSGTFRGETEFKDLAPAEASAAIERNMRAMGIQMRVPKPLPTVTEEPLLTSTTVHQEIETTNTATAAEPRPNEAGNGLTVAGTEGTGTTAAVAVPPTIATPETSLRRSSPGRHGPVEVVVETPLLQDPLRSGVHVVATAPPVHEIRTPPEPVATKTLAEPIKVIALSHIKGPVAEALEDIVGEQIVEAAPEVIEEALRDQIVVNAPAAIAEPVPRPAPAEDIPAMAPDNVLPAPTNNNNLEPVVHVLPEPVAIREPERGVASANKEETARAREPRPAPAGTTVPELVGDNSAEEDARIPRAGLGGNPAEQPNVPVVREQRRTEQPLNPAPEPTVTRTEPRSEGIIASNPATTPTVESRRTEQVTSTGQPKIPENADDESIDTLPPASAIPGLTNIGPGPSGVPASAPSPSNRRPGDQSTVHEFFDTRAPGTTTGGRRPPTDILPSFPLETGRPGSLSNTTQPSAATGIRPPSFKTYCEDQSLPNSNTQGSRIPQLENREASNRRRRRRPASPPKTTTEVRPQPHTTLQTGEELPPVHRNPKHSTERTCDIPPLATTASTSPGSGRISFPNFDFGQPSGSLSRGSNLNRVGVTHVPSAPSPPAAGGSPSKSRMSLMDRFSPSGFGWGDRRQTGNPTTTGSLPVSQQSPPQPPGTLIPSASRALVQNPPTTGSSSVPAPPTPVRPSSSPTSGRASRLPLPSTTTQPRTPEHLKPSSSMASSPGARK